MLMSISFFHYNMNLLRAGLVLAMAVQSTLAAFKNEVPVILLSSQVELSSKSPESAGANRLWAEDLAGTLAAYFKDCRYDAYIVANQPSLLTDDTSVPLENLIQDASFVKEHFGLYSKDSNVASITDYLVTNCGAEHVNVDAANGQFDEYIDTTPRVLTVEFDAKKSVYEGSKLISALVHKLPSPRYLIVYGTLNGDKIKRVETNTVSDAVDSDKVDFNTLDTFDTGASDNDDWQFQKGAGLFTKYQFLSPGIIMGLITSVILVTILFAGLNWITALQVTYRSFEAAPANKQG